MSADARVSDDLVPARSGPRWSPSDALTARHTPTVLYVLAALATWPWLSTDRPGTDAVSYLTIAERWATGQWSEAPNAYWSPLLSWLIAPAFWLDAPPMRAALAVSIGVGAFALWRLRVVLDQLAVTPIVSGILSIGCIPFLLHATYGLLGPDLLLAGLLIGYLSALIDIDTGRFDDADRFRPGVRVGVWAVVAFLAKSYALPVVVAHLVAWLIVKLWRDRHDIAAVRHAAVAAGVLCVGVTAWVVPLSITYGSPTLSTTASYHVSVATPGSPGTGLGWAGLLEPTKPGAVSVWEEPSLAPYERDDVEAEETTQLGDAADDSDTRVQRFVVNSIDAASTAASLLGISVVALAATVFVLVSMRRRVGRPIETVISAASVYTFGLLLLFIDRRYMFFVLLLAVVCAAWFIDRFISGGAAARRGAVVFATVVAVASAPLSVVALTRVADRAADKAERDRQLSAVLGAGDRVASSQVELGAITVACYQIGCTYLGTPSSDRGQALVDELAEADVDVFLVVDSTLDLPPPARPLDVDPGFLDAAFDVRAFGDD